MSVTLTAGDLVKLRVWCVLGDQASVNTAFYQVVTSGATPSTDQQVATYMDGILAPLYKIILCAPASYRGVQAQVITPAPQVYAAAFSNVNIGPGTGGTDPAPPQSCGLLSQKTALAGRRFRGRMYTPFPAGSLINALGEFTAAYAASIFNVGQAFLGLTGPIFAGGSTLAWSLIHRAGKSVAPGPTEITSTTSTVFIATQRRRGAFGRQNVSPI